jgi:hypothetical protein
MHSPRDFAADGTAQTSANGSLSQAHCKFVRGPDELARAGSPVTTSAADADGKVVVAAAARRIISLR